MTNRTGCIYHTDTTLAGKYHIDTKNAQSIKYITKNIYQINTFKVGKRNITKKMQIGAENRSHFILLNIKYLINK